MHVPALIEFLDGLHRNNNRPWFVWNKPAYDILRQEFEELVGELALQVAAFDRDLGPVDVKKSMFRIYRDTRFSKDKTPYKTHFSAALGDRSKRGLAPGYYFHIDHEGTLLVGGGIYRPHPPILLKIRRHIAAHPDALSRLLRDRRFKSTYGGPRRRGRADAAAEGILRGHAAHRRDQAAALLRHGRGGPLAAPSPRSRARDRRLLPRPPAADGVASCRDRREEEMNAPMSADTPHRPLLTNAARPSTFTVGAVDETGATRETAIAGEHPLTLYVDKQELLTLMTLGAAPEALAIGYLRNQRLIDRIDDIVSVQVDWDVNAVAITTRNGLADLEAKTAKRTKTSGCGQGTVFGDLMEEIDAVRLPVGRAAHAGGPLRAARPRAPARDDLQAGGRRARLRARLPRRGERRHPDVRRGRRSPQRGRRDRGPDVARPASRAATSSSTRRADSRPRW